MQKEFFSLSGDEGLYRLLGKLDCMPSKIKSFQQKNGRFQTGFRSGPIQSVPLLLLTISKAGRLNFSIHLFLRPNDLMWPSFIVTPDLNFNREGPPAIWITLAFILSNLE